MLMTMVCIHLRICFIQMALNHFILDIHSYLPQDVLEWVNKTLADNNLCIPNAWSNDLEEIYILLVSKIKAHNAHQQKVTFGFTRIIYILIQIIRKMHEIQTEGL